VPTTVIIGAGIAGISAAYHLAVRGGRRDVIVIDEREPLTLTSDKGTWGYRNWWPGPDETMCRFVSRSIDILEALAEETGDAFGFNRRGYLFATGEEARAAALLATAREVSAFGMGPVREHDERSVREGAYRPAPAREWRDQPVGADFLLGRDAVHAAFPYLADEACAALHVRRAGTLDGERLGRLLLARAVEAGVRLVRDRATGVRTEGGRVRAVELLGGARIECERVVLAAGPLLHEAARMLGLELPVYHELHGKLTLRDPARAASAVANR
jgi:glycine/D-amino acid oxidase-like deaminating enzyme